MSRTPPQPQVTLAVGAYAAYFFVAVVGAVTESLALSVAGTAIYFLVAVALYGVFASAGRRIAVVAMTLAAIGCLIQGMGMIESDKSLVRAALVFFGLFLVALGYLAMRSGFAPRWLGMWLVLAGVGWCTFVFPGMPNAVQVVVEAFGGLAEVALLVWLIVIALRRSQRAS